MSTLKKRLLQYGITTGVCLLITFLYLLGVNIFTSTDLKLNLKHLTDAFFTSGVISLSFGLLVFASNGGAYDMIIYGMYRFFTLFKKDHNDVKYPTFYDYHIAKADRKKTEFLFMIIVGAAFILISCIFLIFWYQN